MEHSSDPKIERLVSVQKFTRDNFRGLLVPFLSTKMLALREICSQSIRELVKEHSAK